MGKWNDTDQPLAYLITFRTYGTWLAGDERGSIDKYHNTYAGPRAVASDKRKEIHAARLKSPPFLSNAAARKQVEDTVREVCRYRGWMIVAMNVRTNHVHIVILAAAAAAKMLNYFKSYSTRRLRESGEWEHSHSPWADRGSGRYLWTEEHIARAVEYVVNGQGGPLPELD
jgi:REP element-mobilizing transposase RayT